MAKLRRASREGGGLRCHAVEVRGRGVGMALAFVEGCCGEGV